MEKKRQFIHRKNLVEVIYRKNEPKPADKRMSVAGGEDEKPAAGERRER